MARSTIASYFGRLRRTNRLARRLGVGDGLPSQAIAYKLGERAWLAARAEAARRPGFDLKRWHSAALSLGPVGLDSLAGELRAIPA